MCLTDFVLVNIWFRNVSGFSFTLILSDWVSFDSVSLVG